MNQRPLMVGLGEVLWDLLPSGRALGGAPTNFAYMTTVLGDQGIVASRVGNDDLGREACQLMRELGLSTSYLQFDPCHNTGTAEVLIDSTGQPSFTIKESVAWDFLQWTPAWEELSARADVVCFGSLAQRSPASAETIERFLRSTPKETLRIYDVNLRDPFCSKDVLCRSLAHAQIVKLNHEEFHYASSLLRIDGGDDEALAKRLLGRFDLQLVCITRGAHGSLLVSRETTVEHRGISVKVADTVGAGDAFAACLAHYYIQGKSLEEISEFANRFAAWVATQVGPTPVVQEVQLEDILWSCSRLKKSMRARS